MTSLQVSPAAMRASAAALQRAAGDLREARGAVESLLRRDLPRVGWQALQALAEGPGIALQPLEACERLAAGHDQLADALLWVADQDERLEQSLGHGFEGPTTSGGPHAPGG
jgi:hypothetical protein